MGSIFLRFLDHQNLFHLFCMGYFSQLVLILLLGAEFNPYSLIRRTALLSLLLPLQLMSLIISLSFTTVPLPHISAFSALIIPISVIIVIRSTLTTIATSSVYVFVPIAASVRVSIAICATRPCRLLPIVASMRWQLFIIVRSTSLVVSSTQIPLSPLRVSSWSHVQQLGLVDKLLSTRGKSLQFECLGLVMLLIVIIWELFGIGRQSALRARPTSPTASWRPVAMVMLWIITSPFAVAWVQVSWLTPLSLSNAESIMSF